MPKGIDISEFQGDINIEKRNPDFVIIRAGDGDYWDVKCQANIDKCIKAGIPYGLYWLIRAWTIAEAEENAAALVKFANKQKVLPSVGIWCDVEDEYDNDPEDAIPFVYAFCATIEDSGYYSGVYCNHWYHDNLFPDLGRFDCWIADWDNDPHSDPGLGTMKQYGIVDDVDADVCYVPLDTYVIEQDPVQLTIEERVRILEDKIKKLEEKVNGNQ